MRVIIFLILMVLFYSCEEYNPKGENLVAVDSMMIDKLPEIQINNNGDTINLLESSKIEFKTILNGNRVLKVDVNASKYFINLNSVNNINGGSFTLESSGMAQGYYPLQFRIYFDSKTHSLANSLGAEIYYIDYEWLMFYTPMRIGRNKSSFFKAYIKNNKLVLSWHKYTFTDFQRYTVTKIDGWTGNSVWLKTINDYNSTIIYDEIPEIGSANNYYLKIFRKDGSYVQDQCFYFP